MIRLEPMLNMLECTVCWDMYSYSFMYFVKNCYSLRTCTIFQNSRFHQTGMF